MQAYLFDIMGRQCRSWNPAAGALTLPTAGIAPGRYILRVQSGTQMASQSVVVAAE
jgi:hypothetical protein